MSTNPISLRLPQFDLETQEGRQAAHRYLTSGVTDLNQAIAALKTQIDTNHQTITTTITSSSGGSIIPTPSSFPGLGASRDETGNVTYTVTTNDNGILLILSDASPVAVSLDSSLGTPYFLFATNLGTGLVTFTPTSGLINGSATATLPTNYLVIITFDGTNWRMSGEIVVPVTKTPVAGEYLTGYDSNTGLFSQSTPAGISVTIITAALTLGGTQGSQTFTNGLLTAQVAAT